MTTKTSAERATDEVMDLSRRLVATGLTIGVLHQPPGVSAEHHAQAATGTLCATFLYSALVAVTRNPDLYSGIAFQTMREEFSNMVKSGPYHPKPGFALDKIIGVDDLLSTLRGPK